MMRVTVHTPEPPQDVSLTPGSAGSGEVTISWTAPANAGYHYDGTNVTDGTISSYKAYYVLESFQQLTISTDLTDTTHLNSVDVPSGTSAAIDNLTPGFTYNFAVTAVNNTGESPVSEIITHTIP